MNIGIVGDAERSAAWEKHIRPHSVVKQVDICASIHEIKKADACVIIDDSKDNLEHVLEGIRRGLHCYLISKPPTDVYMLERIHRTASESGVIVQFSHWPTIAPATQWMMDEMQGIQFIQCTRQIERTFISDTADDFKSLWLDELGLCLKWIGSGVHSLDAKQIQFDDSNCVAIHIFIRFDNGSTAAVFVYTAADENRHQRVVSNRQMIMDCNVPLQTVRIGRRGDEDTLYFSKQKFEAVQAAEKSIQMFLKSIQMNNEAVYGSYDALNSARTALKIEQRISRFV